jgi:predicted MFS family arabinose efflux permease
MDLLALMVSAPIGGLVASEWGLRAAMLSMAAPFSLACIVAAMLEEPPARGSESATSYAETLKSGISYFRGHAALRALAFDYVSVGPFVFFVIWLYQPLLSALNVPIAYFGFVHAGMCAAQIAVMNRFEAIERLIGSKKRLVTFSSIIPSCTFLALGSMPSPPIAVAMLLLCSGFGLTRHTLFLSYFNKHIPSDVRATVLSTMSMLYLLISGLLYPVMGYLVEWSLQRTFLIVGAAILVLTVFSKAEEAHLLD